eukprot:scaffold727_cov173-Ochromonas_danica.AAC.12
MAIFISSSVQAFPRCFAVSSLSAEMAQTQQSQSESTVAGQEMSRRDSSTSPSHSMRRPSSRDETHLFSMFVCLEALAEIFVHRQFCLEEHSAANGGKEKSAGMGRDLQSTSHGEDVRHFPSP